MTICIRRAEFSDKEKILQFHQIGEGDLFRYRPARWDWAFARNPFLKDAQPAVWLALSNDRVVGQYCGLAVPFRIAGQRIIGMWGVDYRVLESFRGQGLGGQLKLCAYGEQPLVLSLWTSEASRNLTSKFGGVTIADVVMYRREIGNFEKLISTHAMEGSRDLKVEEVTQFSDDIDRLFVDSISNRWSGVERTQRYLNWKFLDQPAANFHGFTLRYEGALRGFSVLRCGRSPEEEIGLVAEIFTKADDNDGLLALMTHALTFFSQRNMRLVQVATSVPALAAVLQRLGFSQKEVQPCFAHFRPDFKGVFEGLGGEAAWYFGNGDSDWDQFPYSLMPG